MAGGNRKERGEARTWATKAAEEQRPREASSSWATLCAVQPQCAGGGVHELKSWLVRCNGKGQVMAGKLASCKIAHQRLAERILLVHNGLHGSRQPRELRPGWKSINGAKDGGHETQWLKRWSGIRGILANKGHAANEDPKPRVET
jgi:hypothetical protein